jgi:hypothetical protein
MPRQTNLKPRKFRQPSTVIYDAETLLDTLLVLDRTVIELSMCLYNVPAGHQPAMREQNQRVHDAIKEDFRLLLSAPGDC